MLVVLTTGVRLRLASGSVKNGNSRLNKNKSNSNGKMILTRLLARIRLRFTLQMVMVTGLVTTTLKSEPVHSLVLPAIAKREKPVHSLARTSTRPDCSHSTAALGSTKIGLGIAVAIWLTLQLKLKLKLTLKMVKKRISSFKSSKMVPGRTTLTRHAITVAGSTSARQTRRTGSTKIGKK